MVDDHRVNYVDDILTSKIGNCIIAVSGLDIESVFA